MSVEDKMVNASVVMRGRHVVFYAKAIAIARQAIDEERAKSTKAQARLNRAAVAWANGWTYRKEDALFRAVRAFEKAGGK